MNCIKKYLETREGRYSFYFEDLRSGYSYGYNENVSMTAAGCMKLPIAISLIKAKEDKKVNFPFIALLVIILLKNLAVKSFLVSVSLPT